MRQVDKGIAPFVAHHYQEYRDELEHRLGNYCSYCGVNYASEGAIEHVVPKSQVPTLANDWDNLLLACTNCNSAKNQHQQLNGNYYWPDHDLTGAIFGFDLDLNEFTYDQNDQIAQATLQMLMLNREYTQNGSQRRNVAHRRREINALMNNLLDVYQTLTELDEQRWHGILSAGFYMVYRAFFQRLGRVDWVTELDQRYPGTRI